MVVINLNQYAPTITNEHIAKQVLNDIKDVISDDEVVVDMSKMISMTFQSINIIFGTLCRELGETEFHKKIVLKNCNECLLSMIKMVINS